MPRQGGSTVAKKPGLRAKKPISAWKRALTLNFEDVFKALYQGNDEGGGMATLLRRIEAVGT